MRATKETKKSVEYICRIYALMQQIFVHTYACVHIHIYMYDINIYMYGYIYIRMDYTEFRFSPLLYSKLLNGHSFLFTYLVIE